MENLSNIVDTIQKTLGKEESGKIADSLATILSIEKANSDTIKEKNDMIEKQKKDKEILIEANGNLLRQQGMGKEEDNEFSDNSNKKETSDKPFDYRSIFDEKGNLKK